ncbi:MarR family winged helix-turn-helix transcriptional regulator [Microbacterium invictum]|uniref:MarR family transcriptional regulator n=1 Tax=Microbacterium invictum TaxID=515415 RepID=A0ABZ0VBH1_9MICO|nr:MarR family transcriptional regulator [Microbacterium invictum]WQB70157.1 MarR family transcriptional regulator [Microbacterium invictum]
MPTRDDTAATPASAPAGLTASILGDDLSFLLARANALSLSAGNAALAVHDLKARSYAVLAAACATPPPSQRELADFLRLDPSQVVSLVDQLEQRGLVERRADPQDRRANAVVATAAGEALARDAQQTARRAEEAVHGDLDPDERRTLMALLRRLAFAS